MTTKINLVIVDVDPAAEEALLSLKCGNNRFVSGAAVHPNTDRARVTLADSANQADYEYATVLSCSDSRVAVEHLFDAGIVIPVQVLRDDAIIIFHIVDIFGRIAIHRIGEFTHIHRGFIIFIAFHFHMRGAQTGTDYGDSVILASLFDLPGRAELAGQSE